MTNNSSAQEINNEEHIGVTNLELWIQLVVFYLCFAAIGGTSLNGYVGWTIIRSKKLRSRFYIITSFWLMTRAALGCQYVVISVYRILRTVGLAPVDQPLIVCHSIHLLVYYSGTTEVFVLVFLVIDRIVAMVKPIYYRTLGLRQAVLVNVGIQVVTAFTNLLPSYIGVDFRKPVRCMNFFNSVSDWYGNFLNLEPFALTLVVLILQVVAVFVTWRQMDRAKRCARDSERNVLLRRQAALMSAMRNLVLSHAGLTVLCRIFVLLAGVVPSQTMRMTTYAGLTQSLDMLTGPLVLLWAKRDLREECLRFCCVSCCCYCCCRSDDEKSTVTSEELLNGCYLRNDDPVET